MVYRIYVEKKPGFDVEANGLKNELTSLLGIKDLTGLRLLNRYDVEGIDEALFNQCVSTVFSEPPVDNTYAELPASDGVSFAVEKGETLAIVGESGCGKSVLCKSILRLLPQTAKIKSGKIIVDGTDITAYREREMTALRGSLFSMVFQDPMTSLNPLYTIEKQITEMLDLHQKQMTKQEKHARCVELLHMVGIPNPEDRLKSYPHQFSGGMKQRVIIAIALACQPRLLIADEPTTALDVTIQAQILKLMDKLVKEQGASLILITHDLAVVSQMADRIIVMYCGKIVESGSRDDVIHRPSHPYTEGLLNSIPRMGEEQKRLESIPGMVPSMLDLPQGCYFAPRCKYCQDICRTVTPENHEVSPGHCAACHFPLTGGESHE